MHRTSSVFATCKKSRQVEIQEAIPVGQELNRKFKRILAMPLSSANVDLSALHSFSFF